MDVTVWVSPNKVMIRRYDMESGHSTTGWYRARWGLVEKLNRALAAVGAQPVIVRLPGGTLALRAYYRRGEEA